MHKKLTLLILFVLPCWATAQSLSGFQLNSKASHLVYLENEDHLFLKSIEDNSLPILLDSGLSQSENAILRSWNQQGDIFIYEKAGDFYTYSINTKKTDKIELPNTFGLFRYYRIDQVAATDHSLYFSAKNNETDEHFSLYQLDIQSKDVQKLLELEGDVANITLSSDSGILAFTSYQYFDDIYHNRLHMMSLNDEFEMFSSNMIDNVFYSHLSFSQDGRISLRNMDGSAYVAAYDIDKEQFDINRLELSSGQYLLGFEGDNYKVLTLGSSGRTYSILDESFNTVEDVSGGSNLSLIGYVNESFFITEESGITPKSLFRYDPKGGDKELIVSFMEENPLSDNRYEVLTYQDLRGKDRQAFLYYPDEHSGEKFPTILMNYGGYRDRYPDMSYFLNQLVFPMLNDGFGIVLLNTRGVNSERLGEGYGQFQMEDTEAFIEQMNGKIPVDFEKLIPVGHSHGATMVYYYLTHSNQFPGGIAINGAADWIEQAKLERMTGLPGEMGGVPSEKVELYKQASPLEQIDHVVSPMLLFSGGKDTQIPYQINSQSFATKAKDLSMKIEHIHFNDQGHLIQGEDNLQLMSREIREFLTQWRK